MRFIKCYWKTIVWGVIIFILSSVPGNDIPKMNLFKIPHFDKIVHFGMYFLLTSFLISETFKWKSVFVLPTIDYCLLLLIPVFYSSSLEILQEYCFEKRSAEIYDFVSNITGSLIGLASILWFSWYRKILQKV